MNNLKNHRTNIKILHVAETVRGGIATYLRDIISLQAEEFGPDRVFVIAPSDQIMDLKLSSHIGFNVFSSRYGSIINRLINGINIAILVSSLLRTCEIENIHLHSSFAGLAVRSLFFFKKNKPRLIYCPHGWSFSRNSRLKPIEILVERKLSFLTDCIVCVSESERSLGISVGIASNKLIKIPNGISLEIQKKSLNFFAWPDNSRIKLLFVGRLDRQKGIDTILRVVGDLQDDVYLCVAGAAVVDKLIPSVIPENVRMLGWQSPESVATLLDLCDAVVLPSRWEGMPLIAIEAMRASKPVIGSDIGGINEVVINELTGILVPVDDVSSWLSILSKLTPEGCRMMGESAKIIFEQKYDVTRIHKSLTKIYDGFISEC